LPARGRPSDTASQRPAAGPAAVEPPVRFVGCARVHRPAPGAR
jgi:hypothetical protein